jgi:hypothetical protein
MESSPPNMTFRRDLSGHRLVYWKALLHHLANVQLQDGSDELYWNLHENGKFSVDSMYNVLIQDIPLDNNKKIYKLKIPLKIKVFRWYF